MMHIRRERDENARIVIFMSDFRHEPQNKQKRKQLLLCALSMGCFWKRIVENVLTHFHCACIEGEKKNIRTHFRGWLVVRGKRETYEERKRKRTLIQLLRSTNLHLHV